MSHSHTDLRDAIGQLTRYGDCLENDELFDLLDSITDINDDLVHGRNPILSIKSMRETLNKLEAGLESYL